MIGREISVLDLLRLTPKSLTREDRIRNGCIYRSRIRVPAFCKEIFRNVLQVCSPTIYMTTTAFNVHLDLLVYGCVSIEYFSTPFCSQNLGRRYMSAHVPPHDHQKAPMIPHLPIDPSTMSPRSTGIHDILRHVRDPG